VSAAPRNGHRPSRSRYRAGDLVRVKSADQISATLDDDGLLDGLPFMPEMTAFCGRTFRVRSSAHKTCDSVNLSGMRRMDAAVHLEGLHCDGSAHGGCQSRCPFYWKDAWLEAATTGDAVSSAAAADENHSAEAGGVGSGAVQDELGRKAARSVRVRGRDPDAGTYSCQATEVLEATTALPLFALRQYWDDIRSGNIGVGELLRGLPVFVFNKYQRLSSRLLPRQLLIRGGRLYPVVVGARQKTPDERVGIEPGETVEIRSHHEILDTLDSKGHNRGLAFDGDMVPYCGHRSTVHHRVKIRIDERTGELTQINSPCLVLDGVVCRGHYHRFCPRGLDSYWREIWLRRVDADAER
jgi:hypothetical protein